MDFPHGRHDDGDDDQSDLRAPAPRHGGPAPAYGSGDGGPEDDYGTPDDGGTPAPSFGRGGGGYGRVTFVSPETGEETSHYYGPGRHKDHGGAATQPTYRIVCKAGEDSFSLGARGGKVCLVPTDQDDDAQRWIKDTKFSTRVKDEEGYPAIALVNKATGEALKHSLGQSHPVLLTGYNQDSLDQSVLWTESRDVGEGYRCIRMVNNIYLNFDALNGDPDHGGVRDGTTLALWEWAEGDNQRWKIVAW